MKSTNLHSADGSFLGFLFQIERVMLWLSESSQGSKVGIETDDDIVIQLQGGTSIDKIYEQAKNSKSGSIPFSNYSEDLWKTLSIWVEAVKSGAVDTERSIFSAITNKKLPSNRLILKLAKAHKTDMVNMAETIIELKKVAHKLSDSNKKFGEIILNCDETKLVDIIDKIVVLDGTYHHVQKDLKVKLKSNLSIGNNLPFDHIYNALFGAITNSIIDSWRKGEEAWISVDAFNNLYNELISEFHKKTFLEKATQFLPISEDEIQKNQQAIYVEQLKAINCDANEILEAIHDYLRSNSEKNRYAKEFEVTESKFISYYEDLKQHWIKISRPRFKINAQNLTLDHIGYQLYYDTLLYKGKLNNQEPEQSYTYKGAYHYLANEFHIGWHPEWESTFKNKNSQDGEN